MIYTHLPFFRSLETSFFRLAVPVMPPLITLCVAGGELQCEKVFSVLC